MTEVLGRALLAPGAGAGKDSTWMLQWRERLAAFLEVKSFDYDYRREGRRAPDRLARLVSAHRTALTNAFDSESSLPLVLVGKSMGSRVGCHLSLEHPVAALVCFGYPLVGASKTSPVRDEVLLKLSTPILFVQGTRDKLCPLDQLETVLGKLKVPHELHVVESGDHSLLTTRTWQKKNDTTQPEVDAAIAERVRRFVNQLPLIAAASSAVMT